MLHAWSFQFTKEKKIKVAYEMLKSQGIIKDTHESPPEKKTLIQPKNTNYINEDVGKTKLLQKLLQSKNPEDLVFANKLIKTMVREVSTLFSK